MADEKRLDIVLPTGERATVPEADYDQAIAAGAKPAPVEEDDGGALGAGAAAILGAGSTATFGLSDAALSQGAYVAGGRDLQRELLGNMQAVRERNRLATMAGEGAGLFLNPAGITGVGEAAEGAIAARVGQGLLGRTLSMAGRGAAEGAILGAQHQITEDTLGDHELNGQKIFASAAKDALLGGALGGALGAGGYYLGELGTALRRTPGRASDAVLDEVAGASGAGRLLRDDARAAEGLIADAQRAGATSEQAARIADEVQAIGRERAGGPVSGAIDELTERYIQGRAGGNAELAETLRKGITDRATRLAERGKLLDQNALRLKAATDRVLTAERAMDEAQFLQRPDRMAKLIDVTRGDLQRDLVAKVNQQVDETLQLLESTATKGGSAVAVTKVRKQWTDVRKLSQTLARDPAGRIVALKPKQLHELYMGVNRLKQSIGKEAGFGVPPHLRTEAQREFGGLYENLRVALEDEAVWGTEAGTNQRVLNEVFSTDFKRASDFGHRFTVGLDEAKGIPLPEADAEKLKAGLLRKLGSEADSQQAIKSTETWIDRNRRRIEALEKYGDLTSEQAKLVAEGRSALSEFEKTLAESRKEAEILAKLEEQQLEEQGKGLGGALGLATDLMTRPLTTIDRLASLKQQTQSLEKAIAGGLERFFGQKGTALAEKIAPRPKAEVAREIAEIRSVAGNPMALQERVGKMVGDLDTHAPRIAAEVKATAQRAIHYLAQEAPTPAVPLTILGAHGAVPRYSDQQIHDWETKRKAVLGMGGKSPPEVLLEDMRRGKLNREAIRAIEFVSPRLYAELQDVARAELERMAARGTLQRMPYQQQAALASLLKVPAGGTWTPDFMALMQAAKAVPMPTGEPIPGPAMGPSKRAIKMNTDVFATEGARIEGMVA